jgi:hypothetical protein
MQEVLLLGGRGFEAAAEGTSFEQDEYLMGIVLEHGIHEVIQAGGDIAAAVVRAGCTTQLLAGLLMPAGEPWRREQAEATARHFASIRDPKEKNTLQACLLGLLRGFFEAGAASSTASRTSSPATKTTKTGRSRATKPARGSAVGKASVRRSPTTTRSG